jgi:hypothetical protein
VYHKKRISMTTYAADANDMADHKKKAVLRQSIAGQKRRSPTRKSLGPRSLDITILKRDAADVGNLDGADLIN